MPRAIHINRAYRCKEGDCLAPFLERACAELAASRPRHGYSRQPLGVVSLEPGQYRLTRDVGLDSNGTVFEFTGSLIELHNGASFWVGAPSGKLSEHWVDAQVWDATMPHGRKSFRSDAQGKRAVLRNYDSLAALDLQHDWTAAPSITVDLSLGRESDFEGTWHSILGHDTLRPHRTGVLRVTALETNSPHPAIGFEFTLQDGPCGTRYLDRWVARIPGFHARSARRDLSFDYTPSTAEFRLWVDRTRVAANRQGEAPPQGLTLASNLTLAPLSFPNVGDDSNVSAGLTLHGLRVVGGPIYRPDKVGEVQTYRDGSPLTDQNVFDAIPTRGITAGDEFPSTVWSMQPSADGRSFVSRAVSRTEGRSQTRAFRIGGSFHDDNFPNPPSRVRIVGLTCVPFGSGEPTDSGAWGIPLMLGRGFGLNVEGLSAPDGVFNLVNSVGISFYPTKFVDTHCHACHTAFVARFFSPVIEQHSTRQFGRAVVRGSISSGTIIRDAFGIPEGFSEALVVQAVHDWESSVVLDGLVNDNEASGYGFAAGAVYFYDLGRRCEVELRNINWGNAGKVRLPLLTVDRRQRLEKPSSFSASIGSLMGHNYDLLRVHGPSEGVKIRYTGPPDGWTGSRIQFPAESADPETPSPAPE